MLNKGFDKIIKNNLSLRGVFGILSNIYDGACAKIIFGKSSILDIWQGHDYALCPAGIYPFKVNNRNTRTRCEICSKLLINISERRLWNMFKVNNKDTRTTPGIILVSLLLTLNIFSPCSSVSIVNFKHVTAGWVFSRYLAKLA